MNKLYANSVRATNAPQTEPIPGRNMVKNEAGGYAFAIDDFSRLRRFLILGSEGGTYYAAERRHTFENVEALLRCIAQDGPRVVAEIVRVSHQGLAPKNDPAVFALAVASVKGNDATRHLALTALPEVCRIGTHLFAFAEAREAVGGGWGRGMRKAVAQWYRRDDLVLQLLKYQQREGWSHRDLLRLSHPKPVADAATSNAAIDAACAPDGGLRTGPTRPATGTVGAFGARAKVISTRAVRHEGKGWKGVEHPLAMGYCQAHTAAAEGASPEVMAVIVAEFKLPRELVPTEYLAAEEVQRAMLPHLGLMALVRNLGNMSKSGLLKPLGLDVRTVCERLTDQDALRRSRIHPFALLLAARTYASGHGIRSQSQGWVVVPDIVAALDDAFHLAFHNVVPTNKRHMLGIDVSSSMESVISGSAVSSAEAAAAMALATVRVEPSCYAFGFANAFRDLGITRKSSLLDVLSRTTRQNFGATDCAVAINHALNHSLEVDAFCIYTDNETWAGKTHVAAALERYRKESNIPARLACIAFTSSRTSIGDALTDPGTMDFVGLDASLPQALAAFVGGEA